MPFVNSFTAEQLYSSPTTLRIIDTSTGSDDSILGRRVYLRQSNGKYLVPEGVTTDYITWDIFNDYIDIEVLNIDYALEIKVVWIDDSDLHIIRVTQLGYIRTTMNGNIRVLQ